MADAGKQLPSGGGGGGNGGNLISDIRNLLSIVKTRRTRVFVYGFMFTFVAVTAFLAFNPSPNSSSPWFNNIFSSSSSSSSSFSSSDSTFRSQFPSVYSYLFPNSTDPSSNSNPNPSNITRSLEKPTLRNSPSLEPKSNKSVIAPSLSPSSTPVLKNLTAAKGVAAPPQQQNRVSNFTASLLKRRNDTTTTVNTTTTSSSSSSSGKSTNTTTTSGGNGNLKEISKNKGEGLLRNLSSLMNCNIFDGGWVRDDSYPLYPPGSCPHIDEPFNCVLNSRPDGDYQKLRWKPKGCDLPRLNGLDMLELLRGKRLVFVGDSLNRNMWESLVCILRHSVKDKSKVFEASGRREFRTEGSYSFIFKDYNCSVEFVRSPFLVQEWEMPDGNGTTKETLRLDLVERSSTKYKDADIIVFNTGHWWTHDKTSKGKDYYQVGNHIYGELNVVEAFHKALLTWAKWVDANINPNKTHVLFRGYSASHFSGGQWNSGGACDSETKPITNETYLSPYPPKMRVLESVLNEMKTSVFYLNITRMTDYRKDAHPSIYRKKNLPPEERKSPLRYQDCSHWCLPGVPDIWNELLYAEILMQHHKKQLQQQPPAQQKHS